MSAEPPPESLRALFEAERSASVADLARRESVRAKLAASVGAAPLGGSIVARNAMTTIKVIAALALVVGAGILATRSSHVARREIAVPMPAIPAAPQATSTQSEPDHETDPPPSFTVVPNETSSDLPSERTRPSLAKSSHSKKSTVSPSRETHESTQAELLNAAWIALSKDQPDSALALVEKDESSHPRGALVEERFAIRIEALSTLHRDTEAGAQFTRFVSLYPASVHRARLARAVGTKESL